MIKTYQEELLLRTCNCDFMGTWRPSAILEAMQEASGMHSEMLGCGRNALLQQNIVWVLSRCEIQMDKYPVVGDRVIVETFPTANRRWFFPRYFIFRDEQGEIFGKAVTLWLLLDINTRHMTAPGDVVKLMPDNSDLIAPLGLPATIDDVKGADKKFTYTPVYTDIDVNLHVNNTKYADWLCNSLGIETMQAHCLQSLIVNYNAEILPNQEINLHIMTDGNAYRMTGQHQDKSHFEIGGQLMTR